jgi:AraC-like DNA-binding protein
MSEKKGFAGFFLVAVLVFWVFHGFLSGANFKETELQKKMQQISKPEEILKLLEPWISSTDSPLSAKVHLEYAALAWKAAQELSDPRKLGFALKHLALANYRNNRFNEALDLYFQARKEFSSINDSYFVAVMNDEIGHMLNYCFSDYSRALLYYQDALAVYQQLNDAYRILKSITYIGDLYVKKGDYKNGARQFLKADKLSQQLPADVSIKLSKSARASVLINLSNLYLLTEETDKALTCIEQANQLYQELNRQDGHAMCLEQWGRYYLALNDQAAALSHFNDALALRTIEGDPLKIAVISQEIGYIKLQMALYPEAIDFFNQAMEIYQQRKNERGVAGCLLGLGKAYRLMQKPNLAETVLNKSIDICQKHACWDLLNENYKELALLYADLGLPEKAIASQNQSEKIEREKPRHQLPLSVLKIIEAHEKEKMNQQIRLLEKEQRRVVLINILLLLAAVISGVVILGYRRLLSLAILKFPFLKKYFSEDIWHYDRHSLKQPGLDSFKYKSSSLTPETAQFIITRLSELMEKEKIFLDNQLNLNSLAERMDINRSYLSQVFNLYMGRKFTDYINSYRLQEAQRILSTSNASALSVLEIGMQVGFNSKASFYKTFKKHTGQTPMEFARKNGKLLDD